MPEPIQAPVTADAINAIEKLAVRAGSKSPISDPNGYVIVPEKCSAIALSSLWREDLLPSPLRVKRTVYVHDMTSLAAYWKTYRNEHSLMFADESSGHFVGIIDANEPNGTPHWGSHVVLMALKDSPELITWKGANGKQMKQADFALFVEDNAPDIIEPTPATMIEMARTLEGTIESKFTGAVREKDGGHRLKYETIVDARAGDKGEMRIPDQFLISIPLYANSPRIDITARLRFRIQGGGCTLWYDMWRLEDIRKQAFDAILQDVREACGQVLLGVY